MAERNLAGVTESSWASAWICGLASGWQGGLGAFLAGILIGLAIGALSWMVWRRFQFAAALACWTALAGMALVLLAR
jgi:hypothetical protein